MRTEPTRRDVRELVLAAFNEVVGVPPPHGLDTTPEHLADWSSLTRIRLLHAIEQQLGCMLDERFLATGYPLSELVDAACAAVYAVGES